MNLRDRIEKWSIPEPNSGCWLWFGAAHRQGYGNMWIGKKSFLAHRVSWAVYNGQEIPSPSIKICHSCDNPPCVNPEHLWSGSTRDNALDCWKKGRQGPRDGLSGENNSMACFTNDQVMDILDELHAGKRGVVRVIAKRLGVAETTITSIKTGRNWPTIHAEWHSNRNRRL